MQIIWSSKGIHVDASVCVDVKAGPQSVVLGQLHGENGSFASDLRLSPDHADAIADALREGARKARAVQS